MKFGRLYVEAVTMERSGMEKGRKGEQGKIDWG